MHSGDDVLIWSRLSWQIKKAEQLETSLDFFFRFIFYFFRLLFLAAKVITANMLIKVIPLTHKQYSNNNNNVSVICS